MNKKLCLNLAISLFAVLLLTSLTSANYYNGDYSTTDYYKTTSSGSYYGPSSTKTIDYHKSTDTIYLNRGGYQKTTTYTKTVTEKPDYYYPRYEYYGSYYPKSSYTSYQPYYKYGYWSTQPQYSYQRYGSGSKYGYGYYYQPTYYQGSYTWRY